MRRMLVCIALFGLLSPLSSLLSPLSKCLAQKDSVNRLDFSLELLTHGEMCNGGLPRTNRQQLGEDKSRFLLALNRLKVDYQRPGLEACAVLQNKTVWGMAGNQDIGLYEAWVKMSAKNGLFAQVGRVELSYDDERIIGADDFAMSALSHDILRAGFEGYGHKLHLILAYNQDGDSVYHSTYYNNGAQFYKSMQTVWYHYDIPGFPLGVSLLFMNYGLQAGKTDPSAWDYRTNSPRTEQQQMYGGYLNFHPKYLTLEAAYYRQTGKEVIRSSMNAGKVDAWMTSIKATVAPTDNYQFVVGYDYLSGDDYVPVTYGGMLGLPRHEVNKGFRPLFGSNIEFYGMLDYFYKSAYINDFTPGLQNAFFGVSGNPVKKLNCGLKYHYLATATKLNRLNQTLGHSFELKASYDFTQYISLTASYTYMIGTETMDRLKQGVDSKYARWGWFTLSVSPSLFTTKW